ncbi:hypothetical protein C2S51_006563 [Perilla frutescens var. frutescens]|nr:hypothetical protein C2S51_006563 [Perilla frutescens var. frutescens]
MGTVVDMDHMVGNDEAGDEDFPSQDTADPVVYQLVRVDGNGRLVPATDDEVIAVEDLLEDDKCKITCTDADQTLECSLNYGSEPCGSNTAEFEGSDQPQLGVLEVGTEKQITSHDPDMGYIEVDVKHEDKISKLVPNAIGGNVCQSGSLDGGSKHLDGSNKANTSNSPVGTDFKPDFSLLNGEIHLDSLSVKDLQEVFQATFGRKTSVKDKQWLKRRIIMGLTNSCDFSTTTLVMVDNRVVKKGKDETSQSIDSTVLVDCVVTSAIEADESLTASDDKQIEIQPIGNATGIQSSITQDNCESNDTDTEQRPVKRVRKPTRRYIEELSEGESRESGAQIASSVEHPACDQPSTEACVRPIQNFGLDRRYLTRKDSLGGFGIQVPYVSRIRRSRPRENFMTLMPNGMGISTGPENSYLASSKQFHNDSRNIIKKSSSPRCSQEPPVAYPDRCTPETEKETIQLEKEVKLKNTESLKDNSDGEVVTVPTANGGMRRKHHRPWTLSEVVKLVEGVAKYGAGRWSEIKRLAFASYSYRTSVDLKDKWRNLLRASMAESPTGNGMQNSRKQASVPIPAHILSRVRELSDIQTQVPPSLSSSKLVKRNDSDKSVHVVDVHVSYFD